MPTAEKAMPPTSSHDDDVDGRQRPAEARRFRSQSEPLPGSPQEFAHRLVPLVACPLDQRLDDQRQRPRAAMSSEATANAPTKLYSL